MSKGKIYLVTATTLKRNGAKAAKETTDFPSSREGEIGALLIEGERGDANRGRKKCDEAILKVCRGERGKNEGGGIFPGKHSRNHLRS